MKSKNKPAQPQTKPQAMAPAHQSQQATDPKASTLQAADPERIRQRAYERWEAAGRPDCDGVSFWLEAERECAS
jgi:hypothetical protein